MPNKNYDRGRASEYKAQRDLEALGYQTTRTAGSHGAADVIAWNEWHTRYVQCKTFKTRSNDYKDDLKKMSELILPPNSQVEMWVRQIGRRGWQSQKITRLRIGLTTTVEMDGGSTYNTSARLGALVSNGMSVVLSHTLPQEPLPDVSTLLETS